MSYTLIHFSEKELACRHCGVEGCTDDLKRALDDYRDVVGRPVLVHDAFRCDQHNAAVSLVNKSQHPKGTAADVEVPGLTLQQMYDAAKRVPAFNRGGIGVYSPAGRAFVHLDTREIRARWAFVGNQEEPITALVQE